MALGLFASQALFAQQQDFSKVEIHALKVRDNIYMLVGSGGNITVQFGSDGILMVDTEYAALSEKIMAKIREISPHGTLRYIIDTHHHGDHVGGNANLRAMGSTVVGGNVGADISDAGEGTCCATPADTCIGNGQASGA